MPVQLRSALCTLQRVASRGWSGAAIAARQRVLDATEVEEVQAMKTQNRRVCTKELDKAKGGEFFFFFFFFSFFAKHTTRR
jgi:hypothetical protein